MAVFGVFVICFGGGCGGLVAGWVVRRLWWLRAGRFPAVF